MTLDADCELQFGRPSSRSGSIPEPSTSTNEAVDSAMRSVWDVRERLQENFERVEAALRALEAGNHSRDHLEIAGEIRQHIALANKTLETSVRAEAVQAFQEVVLQALAEANATVRRKVIETLNARIRQVNSEQCKVQSAKCKVKSEK